jgi:hypothetical protein
VPAKKTSGPWLLEWRDWGSYGLSGAGSLPVYGYAADCQSGTCIDRFFFFFLFFFVFVLHCF